MIKQIAGSDGRPFWIPEVDNVVTCEIAPGKYWEPYLLPLFQVCCRSYQWTVEVGAYVGDHTIALAQLGPVFAVEPQPLPWALLGLNLATRRVPHPWQTTRSALYSRAVTLEPGSGWRPDHPSNSYQLGAPCGLWATTFDDLPTKPTDVGFLKVDAQGCDLHVLRGAERMIDKDRPIILCEFEPGLAQGHGDDAESYRGWFAQHGYTIAGFLGGNILGVPHEVDGEPYWHALTNQGIELTT